MSEFSSLHPHAQFVQSREWGLFQERLGRKTLCIPSPKKDSSVLSILLPIILKRSYLYCPRGPIVASPEELDSSLSQLIDLGKTAGAIFVRCEPTGVDPEKLRPILHKRRAVESLSIQPKTTLLLDLLKSEEILLAEMHPKTRYNLRLAAKKNVYVDCASNMQGKTADTIRHFVSLLEDTSQRNSFHLHESSYYDSLIDSFLLKRGDEPSCEKPFLHLYNGVWNGKVIASIIVMLYGDTATYVHGGSSNDHRDVMAPYAVHWCAIQDAQRMGYRYYDFGGIDVGDGLTGSWAGITRFKKGFGGEVFSYAGTYDIVLQPAWYTMYKIARKVLVKR